MKKTVYQINYEARFNQMLDEVIRFYGYEHPRTIHFAEYIEKYINNANDQNREIMENIFKDYIK